MLRRDEAKAFYNRFGAKQDSQGFYEDAALAELVEHADFDEAEAVFEFGCGTGRFAEGLLEHHLPLTASYRGVDLSETMVGLARARVERFEDRAEVALSDGSMRMSAPEGLLFIFNMLPFFPIDGWHIVHNLLPYPSRNSWKRNAQTSQYILLGLILWSFVSNGQFNPLRFLIVEPTYSILDILV